MSGRRRLVTVVVAMAIAFFAPLSVAYALWSTQVQAQVDVSTASPVTAPGTPANFRCGSQLASPPGFSLRWDAVQGATSYKVYATAPGEAASSTYSLFAPQSGQPALTGTSINIEPTGNETRHYKVAAINSGGDSAMSGSRQVKRQGSTVSCQ